MSTVRFRVSVRAVVLVAALTLGAVGCKSSGSQKAGVGGAAGDGNVRTHAGLPLPERTELVAEMRPRRMLNVVDAFEPVVPKLSYGEGRAEKFLSSLFTSLARTDRLAADEWFEAFDAARSLPVDFSADVPAVLALSTRGNERYLGAAQFGAPSLGAANVPFGLSARLYLPVERPEKAADRLREWCRSDDGSCPALERLEAHGSDHVVADLHFASDADGNGAGGDVDWSAAARGDQPESPAWSAVRGADAAMALHVRSEFFARLAVLSRWLALSETIPTSDYHNRVGLTGSLMQAVARIAQLAAPESREVADHALVVREASPRGAAVEWTQSYTASGPPAGEQKGATRALPALDVDAPAVSFRTHLPQASSSDRSVPEWMGPTGADVDAFAPTDWRWASIVGLTGYPRGFMTGLRALSERSETAPVDRLVPARWYAVRGAFDIEAPGKRGGSFPQLRGAASLAVPTGSPIDRELQGLERSLQSGRRMPVAVSVDRRTEGAAAIWSFSSEGDDPFVGEAKPPADPSHLEVDLARLGEVAGSIPRLARGDAIWKWMDEMERLTVRTSSSPAGRVGRVRLGPGERKKPAVPSTDAPRRSSQPPKCLRAARRHSRSLAVDLQQAVPRADSAEEPTLATLQERCASGGNGEAAQSVKIARGRWHAYLGGREFLDGAWSEAARHLSTGCELGEGVACEAHGRVEALMRRLRLPATDRKPVRLSSLHPEQTFRLARDEYTAAPLIQFRAGPRDAQSMELSAIRDATAASDGSEARASLAETLVIQRATLEGGRTVGVVAGSIDRTVPSRTAIPLVEFAGEQELGDKRSAELRLAGRPRPPSRPDAVVLRVRETVESPDPAGWLLFRTASGVGPKLEAAATVELRAEGVDVRVDGESLAPIEDCPDDGPTVCLAESASEVKGLIESATAAEFESADEEDAAFRRLSDAYRISEVRDRISTLDGNVPVIVELGRSVPFGLVARLAAAAGDRPVALAGALD